jgi:hypothetical protein
VASVPEFSPGSTTQTVADTGDFGGAYYLGAANAHLPVNIYNPFSITTPYDWWDPRTQFTGNVLTAGLIDNTAQKILSYLPKPNRTTPNNLQWGEDNYAWSQGATLPYDSATIRLDRNFTEKDKTYIRFNWTKNWQNNADAQTFDSLPGPIGRAVDPLVFQTHFFIADWQHAFGANSLFDLHLSYQRFAYNQNQGPSPFDLSKDRSERPGLECHGAGLSAD